MENDLLRSVYVKAIFPNMIAILGGTINVFVDGVLIGQRMGEIGIAAVNQSLAVYLILCTIGSLFAAGASAESAHAMGERDVEKGREYFSIAMELAFLVGLILCGMGVLLTPALAGLLGSPATSELIQTYIRITMIGGIFKVLLYIPYFYLRLEGKMQQSALAMLTMTVLNIALDYIFLFPLDMGIAGAAWASVLATMVACGMSFWFLLHGEGTMFRFRPTAVKWESISRILSSGSPMASNNLFSAIRIIALNSIMNMVGGSSMVAVFAITNNLNEFSICVQNGVPQTGSALLGVYHGESDPKAVKRLLWLQIKTGVIFSAVFAGIMVLFSGQVGRLFGSEQDIRFAVFCWAVSLIFATCNNIMSYYYYAIRNATMANLITILRVFAVTAAVAWCMRGLGERIWLFYPVAELVTAAIWMAYGLYLAKKQGMRLYLLNEDAGVSRDFVVSCDPEEICSISEGVNEFCEENALDPNQTMTLSLALEELMMITAEKTLKNQGTMDVRILKIKDGALLRIRSEGEPYNPLEHEKDNLDFIGVQMIMGMATRTEYQSTLGLNTLVVEI